MANHRIRVLVLVLLSAPCAALAFEGPLQVRNQFPLFLPASQPYLEKAATESSLTFSLSHSSVFVMEDAEQWSTHLDIELTELNVLYRKRIAPSYEISLHVPVLRATGGILDRPLAWYHRAFGFPDYERSTRPDNAFLYDVKRNGAVVVQGDNDAVGFGDVKFAVKKKILDARNTVSLQAGVELPTGNAKIGYGNGNPDWSLAMLIDQPVTDETRLYANLGVVFPGDLAAHQTIDLKMFSYAGAGLEYLYQPDIGLLVQILMQSSPYPDTGISQIDSFAILFMLGGRYKTGSGSYEFSLTEDPNTSGAPDFVFNLSYTTRF